jgi:hypothetical protein
MTKHGLLFLGALLASTSLLAAGTGCSDDPSSSGGAGGSGAAGGMGGAGGGMGGAGGGVGGGPPVIDCDKYCTDIMTKCTGDQQQYADKDSCMGVCAALPAAGMDGDADGNTIQCRIYHTSVAQSDPMLHCPHAGPSGGGACGTLCEAFCSVATTTCATEWAQAGECTASCTGWTAAGMDYNATGFTAGDTTECRLYHLTVAASNATSATTHCPHTIAASTTCM